MVLGRFEQLGDELVPQRINARLDELRVGVESGAEEVGRGRFLGAGGFANR